MLWNRFTRAPMRATASHRDRDLQPLLCAHVALSMSSAQTRPVFARHHSGIEWPEGAGDLHSAIDRFGSRPLLTHLGVNQEIVPPAVASQRPTLVPWKGKSCS
jgi:hypothetical protein